MTEYRYRELTDAELRELEPGAEIYVRDSALDTWRGPLMFNKFCPGSSFPIHTVSNMWVYAAIREPVERRPRGCGDPSPSTQWGAMPRHRDKRRGPDNCERHRSHTAVPGNRTASHTRGPS